MNNIYLNIGCGDKKLKGFVNIDIDPKADLQIDVRKGLPFADNTVSGIYNEHFIEHLNHAEGISFLRECRRVLKPNGILRIATPDLDNIINLYTNDDWNTKSEMVKYGYDWIQNRCEYINLSLREWGHKWMYDETELIRTGEMVGLNSLERCEWGLSNNQPLFCGLETRAGSRLIVEYRKENRKSSAKDIVSILIPAYKSTYFREALESALSQTYSNIEIIISDDSCSAEIENIVSEYSSKDKKIKYIKNRNNLGSRKNHIQAFNMANGEYIKFLNDDDVLAPNCIERMVKCFCQYPDITLVTSHRQLIDSEGNYLPDRVYNKRPVQYDCIIDGVSLVNVMLNTFINFIGEPTTVMFRKRDLEGIKPHIFSIAGRPAIANGDVTLWINLLSKGDGIYLVDSLSYFRIHEEQQQREKGFAEKGLLAWQQAFQDAKRLGFLGEFGPQSIVVKRNISGKPEISKSNDDICTVSIIIPVFNKVEYTKKCINAIYANTQYRNFEIIIVNNASNASIDGTDQYLEQLEKKKSNVKVIYNEENLGFAKANNQAATIASGKYLVFLNNDTEPLQGWLEEMVKLAESDESIGVVGSKLLYPNGTIQHAGVAIGRDRVPYHIFKGCDANDPRVNKLREFKIVTGACLLISRELFMNVGMLDEEFINGHEDIDLCFRVKERGKKVIYCPNSVLYHYESISEGRMDSREHNLERTFKKWGEKLVQDDQEYLEIPCKESELNARKKKIAKTSDLKFAIKIGTPDRSVKHWGDIYYARCLLKALERAGCQGEIHYRNEWNTQDKDVDVVIHLRGLGVYEPKPYNVNLMWLVSHPSLVTPEELENYDGILVASREYADILKRSLDTPVIYLPQATDPEHFRKIDTCSKEYDIVFIGNNYNGQAGRQIIKDLLSAEFDFKLWGKGWDGIVPPKFIMGDFVTWDELPLVYNKTRVVLNDHHYFMKMFGFVNNRTFDVAACGTFLISDKVKNIESQIPIITYDNEKDLTSLIYYYLKHEQERESKANEVKRLVVEIFTFDQSAKQILDFLKKIEPVKSEKRYSIPEIGQSRLLRFLETVNTCYELSDKKTAKQMLLQYTALLEKQGIAR